MNKEPVIRPFFIIILVVVVIISAIVIVNYIHKESSKYSEEYRSVLQSISEENINDDLYFKLDKIVFNHPYIEIEIMPTGESNAIEDEFIYYDHVKSITEKFYDVLKGNRLRDGNVYKYNINNIYLNFYGYDKEKNINTLEAGRYILLDIKQINNTNSFNNYWDNVVYKNSVITTTYHPNAGIGKIKYIGKSYCYNYFEKETDKTKLFKVYDDDGNEVTFRIACNYVSCTFVRDGYPDRYNIMLDKGVVDSKDLSPFDISLDYSKECKY